MEAGTRFHHRGQLGFHGHFTAPTWTRRYARTALIAPHRRRFRLRVLIALAVLGILAIALARPVCILGRTAIADKRDGRVAPPAGELEDASRLHRVRVAEVFAVPADAARAEVEIAQVLARAHDSGLPVAIAGARHSMGGQSLVEGGIVLDMTPLSWIEVDEAHSVARVGAGTKWSTLLAELDPRGLSVAIMQSNDSFTVGGSISVDCHGWQTGRPPIAASVNALSVMTADGQVHAVSRTQEPELFSLVLGGYGLFGVILEVELALVPNARYDVSRFVVPTAQYADVFAREVAGDPRSQMAFGRLSIVPGDDYLGEAILTVFRPAADQSDVPAMGTAGLARLRRLVFRASADGPEGKRLRWQAERKFGELLASRTVTRNSLFSEGVDVYANRSATSTDVLHEYFVPRERLADFVPRLAAIVTAHDGNLLNVTVRDVSTDRDAFLRFADQDMFALVLLFDQPFGAPAEQAMQEMTRALVDAALQVGGRHYLPYRLHADHDQIRRAYPRLDEFFARKRALDPDERFQNGLWRAYASETLR
jgi:FAD/FMN-containing dehydrogenase